MYEEQLSKGELKEEIRLPFRLDNINSNSNSNSNLGPNLKWINRHSKVRSPFK